MGWFHDVGVGLGTSNDTHVDPTKIDPNAYQYGGHAGGADEATNRAQGMGADAQGRQGVNIDNSQYNGDRGAESGSRQNQSWGLSQLQNTIQGGTPSVAQNQLMSGLAHAQAAQQSQVASARGGGANLAAAQRLGSEQSAGLAQGANSDAATLRANEIATAMGQYGGLATSMRGNDLQREGMSADQAYRQAQLSDAQRGRNDTFQLGMEGYGNQIQGQQLGAQEAGQAQQAANNNAANAINAGAEAQNTSVAGGMMGGITSAAGSAVAGAAGGGGPGSDEGMKTDIQSVGVGAPAAPTAPTAPSGGAGSGLGGGLSKIGKGLSGSEADDWHKYVPTAGGDIGAATVMSAGGGLGGAISSLGGAKSAAIERQMLNPTGDPLHSGKSYYTDGDNNKTSADKYQKPLSELVSDKRDKTGINPGDSATTQMLDHLSAKSFDYKKPVIDAGLGFPGKNYGVIAQDLLKSPMGASIVDKTPMGLAINTKKATGAVLASLADVNKRLDAVESAKSGGGGAEEALQRMASLLKPYMKAAS